MVVTRRRALRSARWTAAGGAVRLLLQLIQLAVLARLLGAEAFGHFAVVSVVYALTIAVADLGASSAIVYLEEPGAEEKSALFWFSMVSAACWAVVIAALAAGASVALERPALFENVLAGVAVGLLGVLGLQPRAYAEKALKFGVLVLCEMAAHALGVITAIALALHGAGLAALIAGLAVQQTLASLGFWLLLEGGLPPAPRLASDAVGRFLRFGLPLTGSRLVNSLAAQIDVYLASLGFTPRQLGEYSVPRNVGMQVQGLINPLITRLSFPVISSLNQDRERVAAVYATVLRSTSSLNAPVYAFLFFFADAVTGLLLGDEWASSAVILRILALWGALRSIGNPVGSLLLGVGRPGLALRWDVFVLVIVGLAVATSVSLGPVALARAMVLALAVLYVPMWFFLVRPHTGIALGRYALVTLVPMGLAAVSGYAASLLTPVALSDLATILLGGSLLSVSYLLLSALFNRPWLTLMLETAGLTGSAQAHD